MKAAMLVTFLIICLGDYRVGRLLLGTCEMEAALHLVLREVQAQFRVV